MHMISLDIENLLTNIPLQEAMETCSEHLFVTGKTLVLRFCQKLIQVTFRAQYPDFFLSNRLCGSFLKSTSHLISVKI